VELPLLDELKRRRVFRALVAYGIVAFAVLQITEPIMHGLRWPDAVLGYVVVALALGFPIVVGLAWIFDVSAGGIQRTAPEASATGPRGARLALLLIGIGLLAAAPGVTWYFFWRGRDRLLQAPSIAVLPFVNLSGDKENEYFSDGMTEEIINALAGVEGVRIVARTSAFSFKGRNLDVRKIGEDLNVATVLEGSVRREGSQLRVSAQLIGVKDGYHLWSRTYDRELKSVFSVEDELARAIVQALRPKLVPNHALVQQATASPEAHDLYLKGRYFWNQRTKEGLTKAKAFFEEAIALDPSYALAHSGLADSYSLLMDYGGASAAEVLPRAKAHAVEAVRLDEALAEGHASLGAISQHDYDWATAERELKRAIELKPGYATAHQWYAEILWVRGGLPEALAEAERARQLDPTSLVVNHVLAVTYLLSGDYGRTIEQATSTLELSPDFVPARAVLVVACLRTGKFDEALATLDREAGALPFLRVQLLVAKGDRSAARRLLADVEPRFKTDTLSWMGLAAAHLALGDIDRTFAWLEQGVEARDQRLPSAMKWDPAWSPIRADPRFQKLLRRMNLE